MITMLGLKDSPIAAPDISVIVPTFNEKDNVDSLLKRISHTLAAYSYELIVVDDDSRDGTEESVQEYAIHDRRIRLISRKDERGLATAVVRGFQEAKGNLLAVMDADLQHPPEVLPALVHALNNGADLAIASRYARPGSMEGWSLRRKLFSKFATLLAYAVVRPARRTTDPMSGFFALNRKLIDRVRLRPLGYKILLEILTVVKNQKVVEIPYRFGTRTKGRSKLGIKEEIDYLRHLFQLIVRRARHADS